MRKVIYLGYYDDNKGFRKVSPACITMMNYVIESINNAGFPLTVVSPAVFKNGTKSVREEVQLNEKTECIFLPSCKRGAFKYSPTRLWSKAFREANLLKELLKIVRDGDTLIVYHSLLLMNVVKQIQKKRRIHLVLQVCEVYTDVLENPSPKSRRREHDFISSADSYIFSTELMAQMLHGEKDYVVCLGNYHSEQTDVFLSCDGKIHVVYAGTLDPRKGGAYKAAEAALYLRENYHLHILGFGSNAEISDIKEKVTSISQKTEACITYDGVLKGAEYTAFMRNCQIGLSTQNPDALYNETSFPSKILDYMAHGLRIVSVRIPAIETSAVGPYVYFYNGKSPREIAEEIMKVDLSDSYDARGILMQLDREFCASLKRIIRGDA